MRRSLPRLARSQPNEPKSARSRRPSGHSMRMKALQMCVTNAEGGPVCTSSGIGEATAKLLASKGAKLVLGARREDKLKQIVEEIEKDGGQAVYQKLDVTEPSENDAIVRLAKETFGGVDVVFLNAGIMPNSPLSALKTEDWHQTVDVNVTGVLNGVAAVLPTFIEQRSGQIVASSSVAGLKACPGGAVDGGTKSF